MNAWHSSILWQEFKGYVFKQHRKHTRERDNTVRMVKHRLCGPLRYGLLEHFALLILAQHSPWTLVNIVVLILRLLFSPIYLLSLRRSWSKFERWRRDDHIYVEASVALILLGLVLLHLLWDPSFEEVSVLTCVIICSLIVLAGWIVIDVILVLLRIVLLNQYRNLIDGTPVSVNRSMLLLVANFFQIILCFSAMYLSTRSVENSSGVPLAHPLQSFYFSVVTITTLGYGDFRPADSCGQLLVVAEVVSGFLFVVLIFSHFIQFSKK